MLGIMPGAGDAVTNERNSFKGQEERIEEMGTCATFRRWEGRVV